MAFTEEQIKAIEFFDGPAMVLGTPGSGKTTVIINRVNNLIYEYNVKPENILVITFTRAAAESMEERFLELTGLKETKVRFGTFHSFFYWVVRTAYGSSAQLSVLDENKKRAVIKDILKSLNTEEYNSDETIRGILSDLGNMACNMIDIEYYHSKNMSDELFYRIYHEYEEYKRKNGFLDFDDMVSQCYNLLKDRQDILEAIRNLYPYILVDEYQDTNRVQYEILKLLAHPRDNLYVVGDDDQSIYGFRGARPDIMKLFEKEFPGAKIIGLSYNFRCPEEIVDFSTKIISKNEGRFEKSLKSNVSTKGTVSICKVPDIKSENTELVKKIKSDREAGIRYSDMAILYRTNAQPRSLIYKLRQEGIPYSIKDVIPDIATNPYIKPIIQYIRYARGDHSREVFLSFMNKPVRYISRELLYDKTIEIENLKRIAKSNSKDYLIDRLDRLMNELRTILMLSPFGAVNYIRKAMDYDSYLVKTLDENGINKDEVFSILEDFQDSLAGMSGFDEMFEMLDKPEELFVSTEKTGDRVDLMTLHSAKGLEYKSVHIIDCVEGAIPYKKSKSAPELEEERRLLYVGVTRSGEKLTLYVPGKIGEKEVIVSEFIENIIKED
ncbi:MAG: ATP-dependent helicase [Eubacterium sp.]|nr:ATP-dependent helicase [Eubacterium sp.]